MYTDPAFPGGQHPMRRRRSGLGLVSLAPNTSPDILSSPLPFGKKGGERSYTDSGVIIYPAIMDPVASQPAPTYQPTPETQPATQPVAQPSGPLIDTTPIVGAGWDTGTVLWGQPAPVEGAPAEFSSGPTDVNVSVAGPDGTPVDASHGFGIVEAGLGVLLAFLLGKAWQDRRR